MTVNARIRQGGLAVALAATLVTAVSQLSFAQDAGTDVVARVNGAPITQADLGMAAQEFRDQLARIPAEQRREELINHLVEIKLAARAAESAGLDKDPAAAERIQAARDRALHVEYVRANVVAPITDEAVHKRFDEELAKFVPGNQYHASHILVETEDEAKAIIADLDKGGDFAAIAKEKSKDPGSKDAGGDLGFFDPAQMVKPFSDAVIALPVGTYTKEPVQSQFGWHVIKVVETRKEEPPTFEARAPALRNEMFAELFDATMKKLREDAKVEIVEPTPAPGPAAPPAAPATPAAPAK